MELINATRMAVDFTMGTEVSGRESLVLVIKGTFVLPAPGEQPRLHEEQLPFVTADIFAGDPGFSPAVYEAEYAPRKQRCDVLLLGSAHAPGGRPTGRCEVGLHVGPLHKRFDVVGDRVWEAGLGGISASPPERFSMMPLDYGRAFGGVDQASDDPSEHAAYESNPVGRGFRKQLRSEWIDGLPLPNSEAGGETVSAPNGRYRPMAFGPIGRGWEPRVRYAGTYDQAWMDEVFPFLPRDFDERYYQSAPPDQQIALPAGPLEVALENLTPDGLRRFTLPYFEAPIHVFPRRGEREDLTARLDTIVLEPDLGRFTMQWRATRPLRDSMLEISQVLVGRKGMAWWQDRDEVVFPIRAISAPVGDEAGEDEEEAT